MNNINYCRSQIAIQMWLKLWLWLWLQLWLMVRSLLITIKGSVDNWVEDNWVEDNWVEKIWAEDNWVDYWVRVIGWRIMAGGHWVSKYPKHDRYELHSQ
jgi:hypothetical protein